MRNIWSLAFRTRLLGAVAMAGSVAALAASVGAPPGVRQSDSRPAAEDPPDFRVAVLVSTARTPDAEDVSTVLAKAGEILGQKTGARMVQVDDVDVGRGNARAAARAYLSAHAEAPPDGIIVLSDDAESREYGAYSLTVPLPAGHANRFPSPVEGEHRAYVAVVDMTHLYAKCGYDRRMNHVSTRSRGGECRGVEGLECVDNGQYWMCPDSTKDLNADHAFFLGCAVAHEFVHPFGKLGDDDHWGTAQCTARTGMSAEQASDRRLFQESCGMCPDLFEAFRQAR